MSAKPLLAPAMLAVFLGGAGHALAAGDAVTADAPKQNQDSRRIVSVVGRITDTTDVRLNRPSAERHRLVKLRTRNKTLIVDLGEPGELATGFKEGDYLFVSGRSARINDKPVLFARYVGKLEQVGEP